MWDFEKLNSFFGCMERYSIIFFNEFKKELKNNFSSVKDIACQNGSISFKFDKEYTVYIDRMYLFLKEDDEAFFMRNAEEIFTYLKIRKDYL